MSYPQSVNPIQPLTTFLTNAKGFFDRTTPFEERIRQLSLAFFEVRGEQVEVPRAFFDTIGSIDHLTAEEKSKLFKQTASIVLGNLCVHSEAERVDSTIDDYVNERVGSQDSFQQLQYAKELLELFVEKEYKQVSEVIGSLLYLSDRATQDERENLSFYFQQLDDEERAEDLIFSFELLKEAPADSRRRLLAIAHGLTSKEKELSLLILSKVRLGKMGVLEAIDQLKGDRELILRRAVGVIQREPGFYTRKECIELLANASDDFRFFFENPDEFFSGHFFVDQLMLLKASFFEQRRGVEPSDLFYKLAGGIKINLKHASDTKNPNFKVLIEKEITYQKIALYAFLTKVVLLADSHMDSIIDSWVSRKKDSFQSEMAYEQLRKIKQSFPKLAPAVRKDPFLVATFLNLTDCPPREQERLLMQLEKMEEEDQVCTLQIAQTIFFEEDEEGNRLVMGDESRGMMIYTCSLLSKKTKKDVLNLLGALNGGRWTLLNQFRILAIKNRATFEELLASTSPLLAMTKDGHIGSEILENVEKLPPQTRSRVVVCLENEIKEEIPVTTREAKKLVRQCIAQVQAMAMKHLQTDTNEGDKKRQKR